MATTTGAPMSVRVIAQGDRIVSRVGDHHRGDGDVLEHPAVGGLLLQRPDFAASDLRAAFRFLQLILDLLTGHAQLLAVIPDLKGHVDGGDQDQAGAEQHEGNRHQPGGVAERLQDRTDGPGR